MASWDEPRVRELHEALVALYEPVERTRERGADAGADPGEGVRQLVTTILSQNVVLREQRVSRPAGVLVGDVLREDGRDQLSDALAGVRAGVGAVFAGPFDRFVQRDQLLVQFAYSGFVPRRHEGGSAAAGFRPAEGVTSAGFPYTTTTASVCQQFRNGPVVAGDSRNS